MKRALACASLLVLICSTPVFAHEEREIAGYDLEVGWAVEPTIAGSPNAVFVSIQRDGKGINGAHLTVEVSFGENTTSELDLEPSEEAGQYTAAILPTRPGQYTFHIAGTIGRAKVDARFRSGEKTFDDVTSASDLEFPARDPTNAELSQRIQAVDDRVADAKSEAARAKKDSFPKSLGYAALGAGILGLLAGLLAWTRAGRRPAA